MYRKICPDCNFINASKTKDDVKMWRCGGCGKDLTDIKPDIVFDEQEPVERYMPETKEINGEWEE